jgi:FKBP-type peptidyl-prolyl cis-trans isomerase
LTKISNQFILKDMSENNSKIPSIIALILLVLILIGVFFAVNQPKAVAPSNSTSSQSSVKSATTSPVATNPQDKCATQNSKLAKANPVDVEKLKLITIEDTKLGTGGEVQSGDVVCIDYKGTLLDGKVFDESYKRGQPFVTQIGVGKVIPGWDYGIVGLKEGGKRKLTIPADLAYGSRETNGIPANSTLVFEVELVKIIK